MVYECIGYSTEEHGEAAIRYRQYTTSEIEAEAWKRLPRIEFTDSGHGIVFSAGPKPTGKKKPTKSLPWSRPFSGDNGPTVGMLMDLKRTIMRERREAKKKAQELRLGESPSQRSIDEFNRAR